ncbi:polyphenol oxidase family protein [candidate division WOR-3 bacterium]|nr:polyphenol oxidase family protein [candidate division WOR-3 bacterium]
MKDAIKIAEIEGGVFYTSTRNFKSAPSDILNETEAKKIVFPEKQIHSSVVVVYPEENCFECDGIITESIETAIAVRTADCLPVSVYEPNRKILGIFHCGWRGLHSGILQKGIDLLREKGGDPKKSYCVFYPHICPDCYVVKEDVGDLFPDCVKKDSGGVLHLDLCLCAEVILRKLSITKFIHSRLCTFHNPGIFHSYRRDGEKAGRMLSWSFMK